MRGFTLVELGVTVGIAGVLLAVVLADYLGARDKAVIKLDKIEEEFIVLSLDQSCALGFSESEARTILVNELKLRSAYEEYTDEEIEAEVARRISSYDAENCAGNVRVAENNGGGDIALGGGLGGIPTVGRGGSISEDELRIPCFNDTDEWLSGLGSLADNFLESRDSIGGRTWFTPVSNLTEEGKLGGVQFQAHFESCTGTYHDVRDLKVVYDITSENSCTNVQGRHRDDPEGRVNELKYTRADHTNLGSFGEATEYGAMLRRIRFGRTADSNGVVTHLLFNVDSDATEETRGREFIFRDWAFAHSRDATVDEDGDGGNDHYDSYRSGDGGIGSSGINAIYSRDELVPKSIYLVRQEWVEEINLRHLLRSMVPHHRPNDVWGGEYEQRGFEELRNVAGLCYLQIRNQEFTAYRDSNPGAYSDFSTHFIEIREEAYDEDSDLAVEMAVIIADSGQKKKIEDALDPLAHLPELPNQGARIHFTSCGNTVATPHPGVAVYNDGYHPDRPDEHNCTVDDDRYLGDESDRDRSLADSDAPPEISRMFIHDESEDKNKLTLNFQGPDFSDWYEDNLRDQEASVYVVTEDWVEEFDLDDLDENGRIGTGGGYLDIETDAADESLSGRLGELKEENKRMLVLIAKNGQKVFMQEHLFDLPVLIGDRGEVRIGESVTIPVLDNDSNLDFAIKDSLRISLAPTGGEARVDGERIVYTPEHGFFGEDEFDYEVVHDGEVYSSRVVITVTATTTNSSPIAYDRRTPVSENSEAITIRPNILDSDGDTLSITALGNPTFGTATIADDELSIVYTPNQNTHGTDTFDYTVSDGRGGEATGTITVEITPGQLHTLIALSDEQLRIHFTSCGARVVGGAVSGFSVYNHGFSSGATVEADCTVDNGRYVGTAHDRGLTHGTETAELSRMFIHDNNKLTFNTRGADGFFRRWSTSSSPSGGRNASFYLVTEDWVEELSVDDLETEGLLALSGGTYLDIETNMLGKNVGLQKHLNDLEAGDMEMLLLIAREGQKAAIAQHLGVPFLAADSVEISSTTAIEVLDNDDGVHSRSPFRVADDSLPSNGTISYPGRYVVYTPNDNFYGEDEFYYTVTQDGEIYSALVTVTVTSVFSTLEPLAGEQARVHFTSCGKGVATPHLGVAVYNDGRSGGDDHDCTVSDDRYLGDGSNRDRELLYGTETAELSRVFVHDNYKMAFNVQGGGRFDNWFDHSSGGQVASVYVVTEDWVEEFDLAYLGGRGLIGKGSESLSILANSIKENQDVNGTESGKLQPDLFDHLNELKGAGKEMMILIADRGQESVIARHFGFSTLRGEQLRIHFTGCEGIVSRGFSTIYDHTGCTGSQRRYLNRYYVNELSYGSASASIWRVQVGDIPNDDDDAAANLYTLLSLNAHNAQGGFSFREWVDAYNEEATAKSIYVVTEGWVEELSLYPLLEDIPPDEAGGGYMRINYHLMSMNPDVGPDPGLLQHFRGISGVGGAEMVMIIADAGQKGDIEGYFGIESAP